MADVRPLLDLIGKYESEGAVAQQGASTAYDVVWGGIPANERPQALYGTLLATMKVSDVMFWQGAIRKRGHASTAAGRYQMISGTLADIAEDGDELFNAATQDRYCQKLLDRRGWKTFINGDMSDVDYADGLAREWASFPVHSRQRGMHRMVERGESYYAGDSLNKAHAGCDEVIDTLALCLHVPDNGDILARLERLERQMRAIHAGAA